jgi:O-antigen/teichoic acid export membrane protein
MGLLFKDILIKIIATPDYLSHEIHKYTSSDVFSIVLFILVFYFISAIFNYLFIASKHEKNVLYINIFITIFNIL